MLLLLFNICMYYVVIFVSFFVAFVLLMSFIIIKYNITLSHTNIQTFTPYLSLSICLNFNLSLCVYMSKSILTHFYIIEIFSLFLPQKSQMKILWNKTEKWNQYVTNTNNATEKNMQTYQKSIMKQQQWQRNGGDGIDNNDTTSEKFDDLWKRWA